MDGRTDGHMRLALLGRLCQRVDLTNSSVVADKPARWRPTEIDFASFGRSRQNCDRDQGHLYGRNRTLGRTCRLSFGRNRSRIWKSKAKYNYLLQLRTETFCEQNIHALCTVTFQTISHQVICSVTATIASFNFKHSVHLLIIKPKQTNVTRKKKSFLRIIAVAGTWPTLRTFGRRPKLGVGYGRSRSLAETRLAETKTGPKLTFDAVSAPKQ